MADAHLLPPIPTFTSDANVKLPATELVLLASQCIKELYDHYIEEYKANSPDDKPEDEDENDAAMEAIENMQDTIMTADEIDPEYMVNARRIMGNNVPDAPAANCSIQTRFQNIMALGRVPKAWLVIPNAVKRHRELREKNQKMTKEEKDKEDVLLDFLVFLAGKRQRAGLVTF